MSRFRFSQINVFSADPLSGNPVAVIHGADSLSEKQMFALARWTNLSETTFCYNRTIQRLITGYAFFLLVVSCHLRDTRR